VLTLTGGRRQHCDGVSRRALLTAGAIWAGGFTLADLLRAEDIAGASRQKSVINIHLDGGPPQMDTIDPKPGAPAEIRGEFAPISTQLAGVHISEMLPKLASIASRLVFIRSLVGAAGRHDGFQCQSGFEQKNLESIGGRPAMGCVVSRLMSSPADVAPAFVDCMQGRPLVRNSARPGFLGPAYGPFRPDMSAMFQRELEPGMKGELQRRGENHTTSLELNAAIDGGRLDDRASLLGSLDRLRRETDAAGHMSAMDRYHQQAASILTSGAFAQALDFEREDPRTLAMYTPDASRIPGRHTTSDHPHAARKLLLARRLIEAGVRCVSVSFSDFDTHSNNYPRMRQVLPMLDHGLHALITDLENRNMLDDVTIVAWGEFGRTPKVNSKGGRDHWPRVAPAILAGGGMRTGQVIGSTDRTASAATSRPVHYQDVMATLYHNLGLNARGVTIPDTRGRPQYLLDRGEVIREVV